MDCDATRLEGNDVNDQELLAKFVETFAVADYDIYGAPELQPCAVPTPAAEIAELADTLPGELPRLYERLVLCYRWPHVKTPVVYLVPNPPGALSDCLFKYMRQDPHLWKELSPAGYIPFGRPTDDSYDPVCFDTSRRLRDGDCPVVRIDHEEILIHYRIRVVEEMADSFRQLVCRAVEAKL